MPRDIVVAGPPPGPMRYCGTLSGQRIHIKVPVRTSDLTLCRQTVYEDLTLEQARGRKVCTQCYRKAYSRESEQ